MLRLADWKFNREGGRDLRRLIAIAVALAEPADLKAISNLYGRFGIKEIRKLGANTFLLMLTADPGPASMESLRAGSAGIKAVEPNYLYRTQGTGGVQ